MSEREPAPERELVLRLGRAYRHELANRLQILSGWLQLRRLDAVEHCLEEWADALRVETELARLCTADVTADLLLAAWSAREQGLDLRFSLGEMAGPFAWPEPAVGGALRSFISELCHLVQAYGGSRIDTHLEATPGRCQLNISCAVLQGPGATPSAGEAGAPCCGGEAAGLDAAAARLEAELQRLRDQADSACAAVWSQAALTSRCQLAAEAGKGFRVRAEWSWARPSRPAGAQPEP